MQIGFKYWGCQGFGKMYNYGFKYFSPNYMITKEAEQRRKILLFWRQYGLKAATDAYGAKRSTLYLWWKIYQESGYKVESLNPGKQERRNKNKRMVDCRIIAEIRRLRFEITPNMGKAKVKKYLDEFCEKERLTKISESKIGRIIKDKKLYCQRIKVSHFGKIKARKKQKKQRKPKEFIANEPGDLIEVDTIVKFIFGIKRYIITAIDVYSRYTFAFTYTCPNSSNAKDFFKKLETAIPFKIKSAQTDNGSEFHKYFAEYLKERDIVHYWNYPGKPYRNGHIEKYNRTIQEEFIDGNEILLENADEFNRKLMDWLIWYNTNRYHWSLNLTSPVDYLLKNGFVSNMCWTNTKSLLF